MVSFLYTVNTQNVAPCGEEENMTKDLSSRPESQSSYPLEQWILHSTLSFGRVSYPILLNNLLIIVLLY